MLNLIKSRILILTGVKYYIYISRSGDLTNGSYEILGDA